MIGFGFGHVCLESGLSARRGGDTSALSKLSFFRKA